jgi:hypothetical protein
MRRVCSLIKTIAFLAVVLTFSALRAEDGLSAALARLDNSCNLASRIAGASLVAADFDRDHDPDGALLVRDKSVFHIQFHVTSRRIHEITFASGAQDLAISALDVDHDGFTDLIVEEPFSHQRLFVWLNDGSGGFHSVNVDRYPVSSDENADQLVPPFHGQENHALPTPTKMRSRQTSSNFHRHMVRLAIASVTLDLNCHIPVLDPSPNPLRGPPCTLLSE